METLYEPRRQLLYLLLAIGVGNTVRWSGLQSVLKIEPNQRVVKADMDSSASGRLIIKSTSFALEEASLQWMEFWEIVHENAQVINYVCDLYGVTWNSSCKE